MSGKTVRALVTAVLVATIGWAQGPASRSWKEPRNTVARSRGASLGTGTVQYDPGAPADALVTGTPGTNDNYFGNLFDTRSGSPLVPGTVTQISWYQGRVGASNIGLPVFGPATGAPNVYLFVGSPVAYGFNAVAVSWAASGPFFAGVAEISQETGYADIGNGGVRSATYNSQGFHGQQRGFFGGTAILSGQNVMARVSGSIIIPAELLEFEVD